MWALGVLFVDMITQSQFRNALKYIYTRDLDSPDLGTFKMTQAYIDLAKAQDKFYFIKKTLDM